MTWNDPSAIDGLTLSALEWRRLQSGILSHDTDAVSARPGVLAGLATTVVTLTVTVAAGSAVVTPSVGSNGSYIGINDAAVTLAATAQDATYARIDRVVLRAYDNAVDGSGLAKLVAEIIAGVPAAAPAAPALPAGRLEIAQLQVPKAGAGALTVVDKRTWSGPMGAPIILAPGSTSADLPVGAHLRPGIIAVIGSGAGYAEYKYDGTAWRWSGGATSALVEATIAANTSLTVAVANMPGMTVTVNNPDTTSVWEVKVDLDTQVAQAASATLNAMLVIDGVAQPVSLNALSIANMTNFRLPLSRTWRVTGMAAGARVINVQASATAAWWVLAGSHMLVRQVG